MRTRTTLPTAILLAAGALLGSLAENGLTHDVQAQDKPHAAE